MADKAKKPDFLMYKGKPLVRSGNTFKRKEKAK